VRRTRARARIGSARLVVGGADTRGEGEKFSDKIRTSKARVFGAERMKMVEEDEEPTIRVVYATGNAGKFEEASWVFGRRERAEDPRVLTCALDPHITEIQGTMEEIARSKSEATYQALFVDFSEERENMQKKIVASLAGPVEYLLTEDVSLSINALCGFPGPYVKPMLEAIRPDGLWDLMSRYSDRSATATCTMLMKCMKTMTTRVFTGTISGTIVAPRGHIHHGKSSWNSVFQPDGYTQTLGEMSYCEQARFSHRKIALEKFLAYGRQQLKGAQLAEAFEESVQVYRVEQCSAPLQWLTHETDEVVRQIFDPSEHETSEMSHDKIYASRRSGGQKRRQKTSSHKSLAALTKVGLRTRSMKRHVRDVEADTNKEPVSSHDSWDTISECVKNLLQSKKKGKRPSRNIAVSTENDASDDFMDACTDSELKDTRESEDSILARAVEYATKPLKTSQDVTTMKPHQNSPKSRTGNVCLSSTGKCAECFTTKTPQWRTGPNGPKTVCNACGVKYIGRLKINRRKSNF
jgi:inosine triphosphate pyrophosphatase